MIKYFVAFLVCAVIFLAFHAAREPSVAGKTLPTRSLSSYVFSPDTTDFVNSQRQNPNSRPSQQTVTQGSASAITTPSDESPARAEQKLKVLREILISRNDNDPRLDNDFQNLTDSEKGRLRDEYKAMRRESFNSKGTIVYLLGRNIKTPQDIQFLSEVLSEPACSNMTDCAKPAPTLNSEAVHEASADQITLAYPQIVSLKALEPYVDAPPADPALKKSVFEALQSGTQSKNHIVSQLSRDYTKRYLTSPSR